MKNRRALLFAAVSGLVAALLLFVYVSRLEHVREQKYGEVAVLIAAQDIERYRMIDESLLQIRLIPKAFTEPDALTKDDQSAVIGHVADATIKKGSQITLTKISRPGETRISINIPKESRACTIAVNEISGVAGLIRPGDHVDIVGTFKTVDPKTRVAMQAEAVTLFQNVQVLSVGKNYMFEGEPSAKGGKGAIPSVPATSFSNVTVSAAPRECMDLTVAQQVGVLTLALRSYLNRFGGEVVPDLKTRHSTAASVTGIQAPLEITSRPRWLEMRGDQSMMVP